MKSKKTQGKKTQANHLTSLTTNNLRYYNIPVYNNSMQYFESYFLKSLLRQYITSYKKFRNNIIWRDESEMRFSEEDMVK